MPIKYCWWCQRQLHGDHGIKAIVEGYPRDLHKQCLVVLAQQGKIEEILEESEEKDKCE